MESNLYDGKMDMSERVNRNKANIIRKDHY